MGFLQGDQGMWSCASCAALRHEKYELQSKINENQKEIDRLRKQLRLWETERKTAESQ
jgi:hypothetical protein